ncbi:cytochrome c-type biogenesis protein [Gilvimarinus sp. DA14]|uniref:cytochrome c-type biogenesis protein n=1 Tax=Gilvimarinus sp. DA14 TaxID=2956798 RepID=UPI0020B6FAD8|nr:cytochrome c-type biogenesis protein [Gilvimarinus sp. DA14]UTF60691.1 cytochrome c-type biogenesis protein CcmH [Gilvimarinus sp. DA14]
MTRLVFVFLLFFAQVQAEEIYQFDDPADRARFEQFGKELRCPQCQNQNIADSESMQAGDLRREVYEQIQAGRSDKEIVDEMVRRYGNYILYRPPFDASTAILWAFPLVLLLVGVGVVVAMVRKRAKADPVGDQGLSAAEQARIDALLATNAETGNQQSKTESSTRREKSE